MVQLMDDFGYASAGRSFSTTDENSYAWIMEAVGRENSPKDRKGAIWVALRVSDGYVAAHENQERIALLLSDDPVNCLRDDDVVSLARDLGLYEGSDEEISF